MTWPSYFEKTCLPTVPPPKNKCACSSFPPFVLSACPPSCLPGNKDLWLPSGPAPILYFPMNSSNYSLLHQAMLRRIMNSKKRRIPIANILNSKPILPGENLIKKTNQLEPDSGLIKFCFRISKLKAVIVE